MKYILLYLLLINILTLFLYGLDKYKARRKLWRIPETTLLLFAIAGGSAGALTGMYTFRHKTQKAKFYLGVPAVLLVQAFLLYWICRI